MSNDYVLIFLVFLTLKLKFCFRSIILFKQQNFCGFYKCQLHLKRSIMGSILASPINFFLFFSKFQKDRTRTCFWNLTWLKKPFIPTFPRFRSNFGSIFKKNLHRFFMLVFFNTNRNFLAWNFLMKIIARLWNPKVTFGSFSSSLF